MKLIKSAFAIASVCLSITLNAQWKQLLGGPFGGPVLSLTTVNDVVYAGTSGGIFKSTNNGDSWTKNEVIVTTAPVNSLIASSGILYVSFNGFGENQYSSDGGATWTPINFGSNGAIVKLGVVGNVVYGFSNSYDLYSWTAGDVVGTKMNTGLSNVMSFAICNAKIFLGTASGLFVSDNGGAAWNPVNTGEINPNISQLDAYQDVITAWVNNSIYMSVNGGTSWSLIPVSAYYQRVGVLNNGSIIVGNGSASYILPNGGSFSTLNGVPPLLSFTVNSGGEYIGTINGVFRSIDGGATWLAANRGLNNISFFRFASSGNTLYASQGERIFSSSDDGVSWTQLSVGIPFNYSVESLAAIGSNVLAGSGLGIYLSKDYGSTWTMLNNGVTNVYCFTVMGTDVYAGNNTGVFVSHDSGQTWNPFATFSDVFTLSNDSVNIYVGSLSGVDRLTSDGQLTNLSSGLPLGGVASLLIKGSQFYARTSDGVYYSGNSGASWTAMNTGLMSPVNTQWISAYDNDLFVSVTGEGLYKTDSNGPWTAFNVGFPSVPLYNLFGLYSPVIFGGKLIVGAEGAGIWSNCLAHKPTLTGLGLETQSPVLKSGANAMNEWYLNGTLLTGITGQSIAPTQLGSYTVRIKHPDGCTSVMSDPVDVKICPVIPKPVLTGSNLGTPSPLLTSNATSGNQWYVDGVVIAGAISNTFSPVRPGSYTVFVTNSDGCSSIVSDQFVVTCALPKPTITFNASNLTLTSSSVTGNQWLFNGNNITGATIQTYTANENGSYSVKVSISATCSQTSDVMIVTKPVVTGDLHNASNIIDVFPNPAKDQLVIGLNKLDGGQQIVIEIYDFSGRLLTASKGLAGEDIRVSLENYASGIYVLKIHSGDDFIVKRFVKM